MIEIGDQCRNRWASILPMFGIGAAYLTGKHGPCPICEGTDRFRFDDKDGRGTFFCTSCRPGDGMRLLMLKTGQTFGEVAQMIRERLGETREVAPRPAMDPERARQASSGIWTSAVPIHADEAERYLTDRGLPGPYPPALRFCPSARATDHPSKRFLPAMLALVTDPAGNPANVHRTFLENGRKADIPAPRKMMVGDVPEGSAIRLGAHKGRLGIAEGIETALAVTRRFGIVCWSAIDAEKMAKFSVPPDVRELHIFGDNDLKFAGQAAAYRLAHKVSTMKDGPAVCGPFIPEVPGTDWADHPSLARAA